MIRVQRYHRFHEPTMLRLLLLQYSMKRTRLHCDKKNVFPIYLIAQAHDLVVDRVNVLNGHMRCLRNLVVFVPVDFATVVVYLDNLGGVVHDICHRVLMLFLSPPSVEHFSTTTSRS